MGKYTVPILCVNCTSVVNVEDVRQASPGKKIALCPPCFKEVNENYKKILKEAKESGETRE